MIRIELEEIGDRSYVVADEMYSFETDELTAQDIWRRMDDAVLMEVPEEATRESQS